MNFNKLIKNYDNYKIKKKKFSKKNNKNNFFQSI